MHAQTQQIADWWARDRGPQTANWVANYQRSLQAKHRTQIVEIVRALAPQSLLEVGCHCGPNLVRLAQDCPHLPRLDGFDVSAEAIGAGQAWVKQLGFEARIRLAQGRFPDATDAEPTGAYDVVLSCYALAYLAPADLDAALYELGRLAARAVILAEPMAIGPHRPEPVAHLSSYREWAHDYQAALTWIGSLRTVRMRTVPITPPIDRLNAILVVERAAP